MLYHRCRWCNRCCFKISFKPVHTGKRRISFATLLTNILGAFLIGLIAGAVVHGHQIDDRLSLFLRVGVCGGFTTFSIVCFRKFQYDVIREDPFWHCIYDMQYCAVSLSSFCRRDDYQVAFCKEICLY